MLESAPRIRFFTSFSGTILLLLAMFCASLPATGQIAYWQKLMGGTAYDTGRKILCLPDGTIVLGAQTRSTDGLGDQNHSDDVDVVVLKYATQGKIFWKLTLGGSSREELSDIIMTPDGSFLCVGTTESDDGDFPYTQGRNDVWVAKISPGGKLLWKNSFGGSGADYGWAIYEDTNGDILVGGESSSINGDMQSPHHGGFDAWLARLNRNGELIMEKHFGGPGNEKLTCIRPSLTGYWLVCSSDAKGGDVPINYGKKDLWLMNMNQDWDVPYEVVIGGNGNDDIHDGVIDAEGNLVLAGTTFSNNGYVSDQHGKGDGWVIKFNPTGTYVWSHAYGGTRHDGLTSITTTRDSGYALVGMSLSLNGDLPENEGYYDGWFLKLDTKGAPVWSRNVGYAAKDALSDVLELPSGGFLAIGHVQEKLEEGIEISRHAGVYDMWMVNFGDPGLGMNVRPYRTPSIMFGTILDAETETPLEASITLTENSTLDSLTSTESSADDGNFVLLLPNYGLVSINVLAKGFLFYGQDIRTDSLYDKTSVERTIKLTPITVGSSLVLENIYFQTARWEVLKPSYPELNRLVAFLELNPGVKIEISGHTDNTGNRQQKGQLSLNRAEAVRAYLEEQGIPRFRMSVKGYGLYRPRASNDTEEGRRLNRRVEFTVTRM